ncbi:kinetochore protein spc25-like [Dorcoceras hygrometricum]|uniref:Kinetochore protein SPC25 n=1 Tax=Dorcoceras hygrometricum TaxID=472368 RepID=A0A2Z7CF81_9LAMI|nr:kinetochore protein spc25-like [Dorcoceras hygrometricum]
MQSGGRDGVSNRMAESRFVCEREIVIQQRKIDSSYTSYRNLLDSALSEAQQTIQLQEKLGNLKGELKEAEDAMIKALSAKTRKEARKMALMESISVINARIEDLSNIVVDQKSRKDEYAAIVARQSEALTAYKEKLNQNSEHRDQIEDAISWYNKVLGFHIECGRGVKFIFTNINPENSNAEYSFVVRHENERYTLLDCDPPLCDTKELVSELNNSNGLFKFVRNMREKFQGAAARGISNFGVSIDQDSTTVSISAPVASDSTYQSHKSPIKRKGLHSGEYASNAREVGIVEAILSPGSSSLRRSSRLKV